MKKKLTEQIVDILTDGPLCLKDIVGRVMESGYEPPKPRNDKTAWAVTPMVVQAIHWLKQHGHVTSTKTKDGRNNYAITRTFPS